MNLFLIRSAEYRLADYADLFTFLGKTAGPIRFHPDEDPVTWEEDQLRKLEWEDEELLAKRDYPEVKFRMAADLSATYVLDWDDVFDACRSYRQANKLSDADAVILLTEHANAYNWFSAGDPQGGRNYFIQTGWWDRYTDGAPVYAIAYEVAGLALQSQLFDRYDQLAAYAHREPRGCLNDLCSHKPDIRMKLRTADLCESCMSLLAQRKVDPQLVAQVFELLDRVRTQFLFRERYPEGIAYTWLPDHRTELERLYSRTYTGGSIATMKKAIDTLVTNEDDKLSQVVSKIKDKLTNQLGKDLASAYIIKGPRGGKKRIALERGLVEFEEFG